MPTYNQESRNVNQSVNHYFYNKGAPYLFLDLMQKEKKVC